MKTCDENDLLDPAFVGRASKNKVLRIHIIEDSRYNKSNSSSKDQINKLKKWTKIFPKRAKFTETIVLQNKKIISDNTIITKTVDKQCIFKQLPYICEISTERKSAYKQPTQKEIAFIVEKKIHTRCDKPWVISLILERIKGVSDKHTNTVDWDNNDLVYIEIKYDNTGALSRYDIDKLRKIIHTERSLWSDSTDITGGAYDYNIGKHVVKRISDLIKPVRFVNDIIAKPIILNRTTYFNELLSKINTVRVNPGFNGIEYTLLMDTQSKMLYFSTDQYIDTAPLDPSFETLGDCVLSVVKVSAVKNNINAAYVIRSVIVENGKLSPTLTNVQNKLIEKYGKLLSMKYTTYTDLSANNYKQIIKEHASKKMDFIEFTMSNGASGGATSVAPSGIVNTIYQWSPKPLAISFLCRECPSQYTKNYTKHAGKTLYLLFLIITKKDYSFIQNNLEFYNELFSTPEFQFPLHFSPSTKPYAYLFWSNLNLDKTHVNLIPKDPKKVFTTPSAYVDWQFISKSNEAQSYRYVEENIWNNYRNPIVFEDLIIPVADINKQMYFPFVKRRTNIYDASIKFNNYVKGLFIENRSDLFAMDFASGKAQDIWRYRKSNIKNLMLIEIDKDAVDLITDRKYSAYMKHDSAQQLMVLNTDLNLPYKSNLDLIKSLYMNNLKHPQYICCFFAFHYMTETTPQIKNITTLIGSLLGKGGEFLYTAFDAASIMKLLSDNKGQWDVYETNSGIKHRKYSIKQAYKPADIKTASRKIKLTLPLNPDVYYDENLINDEIVDSEFKKHGIRVKKEGNFSELLANFKKINPRMFNLITPSDTTWISLYKYKLYVKT
jgi:hypothetical protein